MRIETITEIDAPATIAWEVLGERFADIAHWADAVVASSLDGELGVGVVRTCDIDGFGPVPASTITERLTVFDRDEHTLAYEVLTGLPGLMRAVTNRWTIEDLDGLRCRVITVAELELAWWAVPFSPLLRMQLTRDVAQIHRALGDHLETTAQLRRAHARSARSA